MGRWRRLADLDDRASGEFLVLTLFSPHFVAGLGDGVDEAVRGTLPNAGPSRQIELNTTIGIRSLEPRITAPTLLVAGTSDAIVPTGKVRNSRN